MALIEWTSNHSVGVEEMDCQHQKLALLVNQYQDVIHAGKSNDVAAGILRQIAADTQAHFVAEEQLMAQYGYPDLAMHKKFHADLIVQVGRMVDKLTNGEMVSPARVAAFLKDWLNNHILGTDKLYGQFIAAGAAR